MLQSMCLGRVTQGVTRKDHRKNSQTQLFRKGFWEKQHQGWTLRVAFGNILPVLQPGYPVSCSVLFLTLKMAILPDYGTFLSIWRQLIILGLTCLRGQHWNTEKWCNLASHVARGRPSRVRSLDSRLTFNLMRFTTTLLSQHRLCLVTEAANIISEMCGQGHLVKMTLPGSWNTQSSGEGCGSGLCRGKKKSKQDQKSAININKRETVLLRTIWR